MIPEVSAGSNQVGASVTCTAQVSWPSGPAARVEQGTPSQVICDLTANQTMKFEGKAKIELQGLPANATAEPKEVTAGDARVVFDVVTSAKTAPGQNNSLMVQATIKKDGEDVVQSVARGGVEPIPVVVRGARE